MDEISHGIPRGFKSKGAVLWTSWSLGFAELPVFGNPTEDPYQVHATVGFPRICFRVLGRSERSQSLPTAVAA